MKLLNNLWTEFNESLASVLGEALIGFIYAILILVGLLIVFKVSKGLIVSAMQRQNRTEA